LHAAVLTADLATLFGEVIARHGATLKTLELRGLNEPIPIKRFL
jgi:hypothetical protein